MSQKTDQKNATSSQATLLKMSARRNSRGGILHLCAALDYGDPARETVTMAVLTQRMGWRAMIASSGGTLVCESERAAVKHVRMPLDHHGMFANWRNRVHLEALVQRERPLLIHAHGHATVDMACRLSLQHRLPMVVDFTQPLPDTAASRRLIAHIAQTTCTVRVPSRMMEKHLTSTFQINPGIITCVPPGIDLQAYNAAAISAERLHKLSHLWRIPEQATLVLMPMPIEPKLGHDVFLQAMAKLGDENIYAVLVGNDRNARGLRKEMEAKIDSMGLNGRIIMPDLCPDWPAAFWLANVVVAANEIPCGQNRELLCAQALGRPVIVTAMGANEEMVLRDETAWIIPPENPDYLAKALCESAHMNTDQRVNLADNTRYFIEETFPQANWFNRIIEIYDTLIATTRSKPSSSEVKVA